MPEALLAAVQPHMTPGDYLSEDAFVAKLEGLLAPLAGRGLPVLAVLPEEVGTFLALLGEPGAALGARTLEQAFRRIALRHLPAVLAARLGSGARDLREAVLLQRSRVAGPVYWRAISGIARRLGIWLVGGSALLPANRFGLDADRYAPLGHAVYNTGVVADPTGRIVQAVVKANLVPGQEDHIGLTPGRAEDAAVFAFAGTRVGAMICYDAFTCPHTDAEPGFAPLAPRLAGQGAGILVQPSANPWPWDQPWPLDPSRLRRQQWEQEALEASMGALPAVRFGVTAHLLAGFFDLRFDGRSRIFGRDGGGRVVVLAQAARSDAAPEAECLVTARISLP